MLPKMFFLILICAAAAFIIFRVFARSTPVPEIGSIAPDFTLLSQQATPVSLRDFRGRWVVLYFYPKDMTPGCTREAHNFQVDQSKYEARQTLVLGVSVDDVNSHRKFCAKEGLNFKLLADTKGEVSAAYGSLIDWGVIKLAKRHTFLIDPTGKIARAYSNVDPARHSEEILSALAELQKQPARL